MSWLKKEKTPTASKPRKKTTFEQLEVGSYFSMDYDEYIVLDRFEATRAIRAVRWNRQKTADVSAFVLKITEDDGNKKWYDNVKPLKFCQSELVGQCIYWKDHGQQHFDGNTSWMEK